MNEGTNAYGWNAPVETTTERLVLLAIASKAEPVNAFSARCKLSRRELATMCRLDIETITRAVGSLKRAGIIEVWATATPKRGRGFNVYTIGIAITEGVEA
jgi:DNA-binding MarR family transcriptional regulator